MSDATLDFGSALLADRAAPEASEIPSVNLSIIIPTRNRCHVLISKTLPAMFSQRLRSGSFEIVIVVDGSTDGTSRELAKLQPGNPLRFIEQDNRGPSTARNAGIRVAHGEYILFLDDDIICGPNLFQQHLDAHSGSGPALVYGPISIAPDAPPSVLKYANEKWYQEYYEKINEQNGVRLPQDDYLISNSSMPRQVLIDCGGFDETMTAKEDYELGLRLWNQGIEFKYVREAVAFEYFQKSIQYVLKNDGKAFGETDVLLARKFPEYRPHSPLAGLGRMAGWKRGLRQIYAALPFNPISLLNGPLWVCDRLCNFPVMRKISRRLLGLGRSFVEFCSAARQQGSWHALVRAFGMRLPVLLYHHVGPHRPGTISGLTVSPERFEKHVSWLAKRRYQGICPADWLKWRREGKGLPDKPILFTFDDAYADLVEYAFPTLHRYGFGASVYVVTGQLGGTNAWDEARGYGTLDLMTAEQIREWSAKGIEFGAHSRTHANLPTLSHSELTDEVVGSAKDLESIIGSPVVSFAYPYGFHNQAVDDCVRGAYDLAFIADDWDEGLNDLQSDPHLLRRTMVQTDDSLFALECRARFGRYPFLEMGNRLRQRVALRTRLKRLTATSTGSPTDKSRKG